LTDRPCPLDGCDQVLGAGEVICRGCIGRTRGNLRAVPGLLVELDATATGLRSSWREPGPRSPSDEGGLTLNERAVQAGDAIRNVVHGWARVWDEQTPQADEIEGPVCPARCRHDSCRTVRAVAGLVAVRRQRLSTAPRQALLLADVRDLGRRPWAANLAAEIRDAVTAAERAVDAPQPMVLVCRCTCGAEILSHPDAKVTTCRDCGERWDVVVSRAAMIEAANDVAAPAVVIARMLGPSVVTAAMIRGWAHRKTLAVAYVNPAGQPCYSVAAVSKLAREGAPTRDRKGTES
jgi:hypothetical protein